MGQADETRERAQEAADPQETLAVLQAAMDAMRVSDKERLKNTRELFSSSGGTLETDNVT